MTWILLSLFLSASGVASWKTIEARYWRRCIDHQTCQCGHDRCYHSDPECKLRKCECRMFVAGLTTSLIEKYGGRK